MIERELHEGIKEEIKIILEGFDIYLREDFEDSVELEPDSGLIDTLMAVAEEYDLSDEDMDELLEEIFDDIPGGTDRNIMIWQNRMDMRKLSSLLMNILKRKGMMYRQRCFHLQEKIF